MRPEVLNFLFSSIDSVPGVGPKLGALLSRFCGPTLSDVLWHLPVSVNFRPKIKNYSDIVWGSYGTVCVKIGDHFSPATQRQPYRVSGIALMNGDLNQSFLNEHNFNEISPKDMMSISSGKNPSISDVPRTSSLVPLNYIPIELVFFNYHKKYLQEKFKKDALFWISGRIEKQGNGIKILHPDYMTTSADLIPNNEVIYPQSRGVNSKLIRRVVSYTLEHTPHLPEWLDLAFKKEHQLPSWNEALDSVHHPKNEMDFIPQNPARMRLAYDEILANQLALLLVRRHVAHHQKGISIVPNDTLTELLLKQLPFQLTSAQKKVVCEIQQDLKASHQMIRLLQGDVGSGKTIVALLSSLSVVEGGYQVALMAPTDILARQHFAKIQELCQLLGISVGILTAREKGQNRRVALSDLANGKINILIGTHALLTEDVSFQHLGLVVIDEQHKFGVHQRLSLLNKQRGVNLLVMTATPIPRSLALTAYGDMEISRLDEKPIGRQTIETRVMSIDKVSDLSYRLRDQIQKADHRVQAYWICPLVEESEKSDLMAVKKRFSELQEIFGKRVGLVHGKMKGPEKDEIMQQFARGELDLLVATTVIEVGIDVKSASIMIIEQAERFGLAGLHQLRGRVGRGSDKSLCLLLHGSHLTDTARKRLTIMRDTDDGFVLAEEDLKLRGAGEVLGTRQSGMLDFKMADLSLQSDLIWTATKDAQTILNLDPDLTSDRGKALRLLMYLFKKDLEVQTIKSG